MIALLQLLTGSYMKGAYNLHKTWQLYKRLNTLIEAMEEVREEDELSIETDKDFMSHYYLGYGGFHFGVSLVPNGFQWILKIIGFEGNRESGISDLNAGLELGGRRSPMIGVVSLWIEAFYFEKRMKAEELYSSLAKQYPTSGLVHYLGGYLAREAGEIDNAKSRFRLARTSCDELPSLENICEYEIGWCYYLKNEFKRAS